MPKLPVSDPFGPGQSICERTWPTADVLDEGERFVQCVAEPGIDIPFDRQIGIAGQTVNDQHQMVVHHRVRRPIRALNTADVERCFVSERLEHE